MLIFQRSLERNSFWQAASVGIELRQAYGFGHTFMRSTKLSLELEKTRKMQLQVLQLRLRMTVLSQFGSALNAPAYARTRFFASKIEAGSVGFGPEHTFQVRALVNRFMAGRLHLEELAWALRGPVAIGRLLLILAAVSSLTTPVTQKIWTWDHFLHGGQDFETVTLAILVILCLTILLSHICKRQIEALFAACRLTLTSRELAGIPRSLAFHESRLACETGAGINSFPLKI